MLIAALAILSVLVALGVTLFKAYGISPLPKNADVPTSVLSLTMYPTKAVYPTHRPNLALSDFDFLEHETSLSEVYAQMGLPDRDDCSGIYCPEYDLADGRKVRLSATNPDFLAGATLVDENGVTLEELLPE